MHDESKTPVEDESERIGNESYAIHIEFNSIWCAYCAVRHRARTISNPKGTSGGVALD
jgi:hypothetical protein